MKAILIASVAAAAWSATAVQAEQLSTPAEQAQTRSLNQAGVSGTYTSPQVLNGGQALGGRGYATGKTGGGHGERAADTFGGPQHSVAALNPDDFVALTSTDPDRLNALPVEVADGETIGKVIDVRLAEGGALSEIEIALPDRRHVWVGADALRYNPSANLLLTNMNVGELHAMASTDEDD